MPRRIGWAAAGLVIGLVVIFGVIAPPERCPPVTTDDLREAAGEAVGWFVRNQRLDGTWLYQYDAVEAEVVPGYNVIRHGGAIMGLYQAARQGIPGALESADRGLGWARRRLVARDGWAALRTGRTLPVGAAALVTAGLAERRLLTGDARHDDLMRSLGRFMVAQTEPSGAVLASYDLTSGEPVPGDYSPYYTGEAYWALSRLHQAFPGEGWGDAADRVGRYIASERDDAEGYWPPLADHWAAYGQSETVEFPERAGDPLTPAEQEYARRQAGLFGSQVRWISQRAGPWGWLVRGPFVPRGGGYGVVGEALTGWWLVAGSEPALAGLTPEIAERASCIAGLAIAAQDDEADAAAFAEPDRVRGAWFRDGETRMDDQQHALSALLRTIPIVEASPSAQPSESRAGPSPWLWVALFVLGLNPLRAAFGVPRAGRSRRDVAAIAGLGGLAGALAVVLAGLAGAPLAGALDVSEPALRIGAGAVAALVAATDLVRPPPRSEPSLPGWWAALVPVAVPLVARPGLVILALAAGAAEEVPVTAAAMLAGVVLLAVIAVAVPDTDGPAGRALRWGARVMAAVMVAAAVVLVVGGVLAV
jgi:small neutral amino acid transporter SnatA (MarC family)